MQYADCDKSMLLDVVYTTAEVFSGRWLLQYLLLRTDLWVTTVVQKWKQKLRSRLPTSVFNC